MESLLSEEVKTCSSCKHWYKTPVAGVTETVDPRTDAMLHAQSDYGICQKIHLRDRMAGYVDPDAVDLGQLPAFTEDGSDYRADFYTLPTFGCTLHEVKAELMSDLKQFTQSELLKKEVKIGCVTLVRFEPQGLKPVFYGIQCSKGRGVILPGGKWEKGESFVQCAERELREEAGVIATDYKLVFGGMSEEGYYTYAFTAKFVQREWHDEEEGKVVNATWDDLQKSAFGGYYDLLKHAMNYCSFAGQ